MRRLFVLTVLAGMVAALAPAAAEEIWSCEKDGRLAGRPTGDCVFAIEPGAYELFFEATGARASGEGRVSIIEADGGRIDFNCLVLNEMVVSCEATGGEVAATTDDATLAFTVDDAATVTFEARPPFCGTLTCNSREPIVSAGKLRVTLSTAG